MPIKGVLVLLFPSPKFYFVYISMLLFGGNVVTPLFIVLFLERFSISPQLCDTKSSGFTLWRNQGK